MFYNIEEIDKKVLRIYNNGDIFRDFMEEGDLFPFKIKLKKIRQSDIQNAFTLLQDELKILKAKDLHLVYKAFHFQSIGQQKLPIEIHFETRSEFLNYIEEKEDFTHFSEIYHTTVHTYPQLKGLLFEKPFLFLKHHEELDRLFLVCQFFIDNPRPNIYLRELNIVGVDTKFVEKHKNILDQFLSILSDESVYQKEITKLSNYGFEKKYHMKYPLALVRFRVPDESQSIDGLLDISITIEAFKKIHIQAKKIIIVENKMTMLSFPMLDDAIVIFGGGYGVDVLRDVDWLHEKEIYYWGDIDSDGFAILSQVRGYFPHVISILMDKETVRVSQTLSEHHTQRYKPLAHLNKEEENLYKDFACSHRLEQERIPFFHVVQRVKELNHAS